MKSLGKIKLVTLFIFVALAVLFFAKHQSLSSGVEPTVRLEDVRVEPGTTNVRAGAFVVVPSTDNIFYDGVNYAISDGTTLSPMDPDLYLVGSGGGNITNYDPSFPVVRSADDKLDASDTVVVPGPLRAFEQTAVDQNESNAYVDSNLNGVPDTGDDFLGLVSYNYSSYNAQDGHELLTIPNNIFVNGGGGSDDGISKFIGPDGHHRAPAIILDTNDDGHINSVDHVISPGYADVSPLTSGDKVCFDGSISDDTEFDLGEVIWWDSAGDCASFDTGIDIELVGSALPSGTSTLFGVEGEVGLYPATGKTNYTCVHGGECNNLAYTGVDGTDWVNHDNFTLSTYFFTTSSFDPDGLSKEGVPWDTDPAYTGNSMLQLSSVTSSSQPKYLFEDLNSNGELEGDEPIFMLVENGSTALLANHDTVHLFGPSDHYINLAGGAGRFSALSSVIVSSANDTLDLGPLNGTYTDEIIYTAGIVDSSSPANIFIPFANQSLDVKYYDDDSDGVFDIGDDLIEDVDHSNIYNGDDLLSVGLTNQIVYQSIDQSVSAIYLYSPVGSSCAGAGTDILVGSKVGLPLQDQSISVTLPTFNLSQPAIERTVCVYIDISPTSPIGRTISLDVPAELTQFTGGAGHDRSNLSDFISVREGADVNVNVSPGITNTANDFTFSYTTRFGQPAGFDAGGFVFSFPDTFDMSGAGVSCTVGGVDIGGSVVIGDVYGISAVQLNGITMPEVSPGDEIVCHVTDVIAPATPGTYVQNAAAQLSQEELYPGHFSTKMTDFNVSYRINPPPDSHPCTGCGEVIITPPTFNVHILTPNGGETYMSGDSATISWVSDSGVKNVNIDYSIDGGVTFTNITKGITNSGLYNWNVPAAATSNGIIRIQSTDLNSVLGQDVSDMPFTIIDSTKPFIDWRSPDIGTKIPVSTKQWLLWNASPIIDHAEVEISIDGGISYTSVSGKIVNTNGYEFTVPAQVANSVFFRITGFAPNFEPVKKIVGPFSFVVPVDEAALHVTFPNSQTALKAGSIANIAWETQGTIPNVELQFAPNGNDWTVISPAIANTGTYSWNVPDLAVRYGFIRVGGNSNLGKFVSDKSDEAFWIIQNTEPLIKITQPQTGASAAIGDQLGIHWNSLGEIPKVNLYVVYANGSREDIAQGLANADKFDWQIPTVPDQKISIAIEGLDQSGKVITSDAVRDISLATKPIVLPPPDIIPPVTPTVPGKPPVTNPIPTPVPKPSDTVYDGTITPRVTAANETIVYDISRPIAAIIGTPIKIELRTQLQGQINYTTSDGNTAPFSAVRPGVYEAYASIGANTKQITISGPDFKPAYTLVLDIDPKSPGKVIGLTNDPKTRTVTLFVGDTKFDTSASGQENPMILNDNGTFSWYAPAGKYTVQVRVGDKVEKLVTFTTDGPIINPSVELDAISAAVSVPEKITQAIKTVQANKIVQQSSWTATTASVAGAVATTAVLASSFSLATYLQYLFTSPLLFTSRRRRKSFGQVYNSLTKLPIGLATIRFFDKENRLVKTVITDVHGRYAAVLPVGEYRPEIIKPGYKFPSEVVTGVVDGAMDNVFAGAIIKIEQADQIIGYNFAADPIVKTETVSRISGKRFMRNLQRLLAPASFLLALYALAVNPGIFTTFVATIQALVFSISYAATQVHIPKHGGKILDKNGRPIKGAVIRLFNAQYNKLVETQRTDAKGGFMFIVGPGQYYLSAEGQDLAIKSPALDFSNIKEPAVISQVLRQE